ncbi:hypothetical protein TSUD_389400, partial [Trifolium subterraneum]
FAASRDWLYRHSFTVAGLRSVVTDLGDGTTMHCWIPKLHNPCKPSLVLVHGFGANAMPERTESFQALCLMKLMEAHGVNRLSLVGISYGGFVGYSLAAQFPEVSSLEEASSILLPQTPDKLRELMRLSFVRPARVVMCTDHIEQKRELLEAILKGRQLSNLPKINKPTLIMWGEQDQVFPLELGYRLKRHIGENTQMVIIKNAGHALNIEKPKEFAKHLKSFLINGDSHPSSPPSLKEQIQKTFSLDFSKS